MAESVRLAPVQQHIHDAAEDPRSIATNVARCYRDLAVETLHNLQHQHGWRSVKIHLQSPLSPFQALDQPVLSGLPPRRLYVHPDEQIEHLRLEQERKKSEDAGAPSLKAKESVLDLAPVREWVLPTQIREKWTLSRLAKVFDSLSHVPPEVDPADAALIAVNPPRAGSIEEPDKWRKTKRLLLATVDDDSTVVYYIVHDGIVKPRQN